MRRRGINRKEILGGNTGWKYSVENKTEILGGKSFLLMQPLPTAFTWTDLGRQAKKLSLQCEGYFHREETDLMPDRSVSNETEYPGSCITDYRNTEDQKRRNPMKHRPATRLTSALQWIQRSWQIKPKNTVFSATNYDIG